MAKKPKIAVRRTIEFDDGSTEVCVRGDDGTWKRERKRKRTTKKKTKKK